MKILVSALEASSSAHLRRLMEEFDAGEVELCGIFDRDLSPWGAPLYSPSDFSVMGFVDVLKKLAFILKAQNQMVELAASADKILLLDSSSFHLPLAKKIKAKYPQKEIIYYILPQVWAWKPWRTKALERYCDRLGAILPFEVGLYASKAEYVGHPLLDSIKRYKGGLEGEGIVFMPGSRRGEIRRIFPVFRALALEYFGDKRKILVVPQMYQGEDLGEIYGAGVEEEFEISFDARESLLGAEFAFICSGTATLEASLIGTPFVLGYRAKWLDYHIMRSFTDLRYIGLANIFYNAICGERAGRGQSSMHLELVQEDFTPQKLFSAYEMMDRGEFFAKSRELLAYLKHGSAKTIAQWLRD